MSGDTAISIDSIIVNSRHRQDVGDLSDLVTSIREIGLQNPVCITPDRHLLSGSRRIAAFRELGLTTIPVHLIPNLGTATDRLKAERDENTCRKNMTPSELVSLGLALEELERPKARERMAEGGKGGLERSGRPPGPLDTRDAVAAGLGISGSTYERAKRVVEAAEDGKAPSEVRQAAQQARAEMDATGAINPAYKKVRRAQQTPLSSGREVSARTETRSVRIRKLTAERFITKVVDQLAAIQMSYEMCDLDGYTPTAEQIKHLQEGRAILARLCRQFNRKEDS